MQPRPQDAFNTDPIAAAALGQLALHAAVAELKATAEGGWITLFGQTGKLQTRDGRAYTVDPGKLIAVFREDGIELPIDVNHATDTAGFFGGRSDAVGWISDLKVEGGALLGLVEWLEEGKAILAARTYRYVSPTFFHDANGVATRLKAVALVTAPALARQVALAAVQSAFEEPRPMKSLLAALGLADTTSETDAFTALQARLQGSVAKAVHDATLAQLQATTTELETLRSADRTKKVNDVIEAALTAKKIVPAQRDHYVALCATDDGLVHVEKLFAASPAILSASKIDGRKAETGVDPANDPVKLAAAATKRMEDERAAGRTITIAEAMGLVKADLAAA